MNSRILPALCFAALTLSNSSLSFGQTGLATLTGTLSDQSGAVVAGIEVHARHIDTGQILSMATTSTGNYSISQMPIGAYEIAVDAPGFKAYKREGISLAAAQVLRLDIELQVGAATDAITVTGQASMLETESGDIAHNITVSQMQDLPILPVNGATGAIAAYGFRDPYGLAQLLPGVQYTANNVMVINGMGTATAQYRIEGQNSGLTGNLNVFTQFTQPSVDSVQEVAVQTSNFAAEFGTVGGGIFNVTMKSGTNQLHGSVYDYAINEVLNAHQPSPTFATPTAAMISASPSAAPSVCPKSTTAKTRASSFSASSSFAPALSSPPCPRPFPRRPTAMAISRPHHRQRRQRRSPPASGRHRRRPAQLCGSLGSTSSRAPSSIRQTTRSVTCSASITADCPAGSIVQVRTPFPGNKIPQTVLYLDSVPRRSRN